MKLVNIIISILLSMYANCQPEMSSFTLKVYANDAQEGSVIYIEPIVEKSNYYKFNSDSSLFCNGKFTFSGKLYGPLGIRLIYKFDEVFARSEMIFIEKGKLSTRFSLDTLHNNIITVDGSKSNQQYQNTFQKIATKYKLLNDIWTKEIQSKYEIFSGEELDSATSDMRIRSRLITSDYSTEIANYASRNTNSLIPIFIMLNQNDGYDEKFAAALKLFSSEIKLSYPYTQLYSKMMKSKSLIVGEYFPKINLINLANNFSEPISFHYSNKYTLIDFWFAKCGACIRQFPAYGKINKTYNKTDSFRLINITIDPEREILAAKKIIKDLNADWIHLWDRDGKNASLYNINSYPTNFLIDNTGKIIAKNIEPIELNRILKNLN